MTDNNRNAKNLEYKTTVHLTIGAVDGITDTDASKSEAIAAGYSYQTDICATFDNEGQLVIRLKGGDGSEPFQHKPLSYLTTTKDSGDALKVDKLWYVRSINDEMKFIIGAGVENYHMYAHNPSKYSELLKAFKNGGAGPNYGGSTGVGGGICYVKEGIKASVSLVSKGADSSKGLLTNEDNSKINVQLAYCDPSDQFDLSINYAHLHMNDSGDYFMTNKAKLSDTLVDNESADAIALRGNLSLNNLVNGTNAGTLTVGLDFVSYDNKTGADEGFGYMVGYSTDDLVSSDDKLTLAIGAPIKVTGGTNKDTIDPFMWELAYSFKITDGIILRPGIFGSSDAHEAGKDDIFGTVLGVTMTF